MEWTEMGQVALGVVTHLGLRVIGAIALSH
jgi:hypothetical protein